MTVPFDPNRGELFKIEGDKPGWQSASVRVVQLVTSLSVF